MHNTDAKNFDFRENHEYWGTEYDWHLKENQSLFKKVLKDVLNITPLSEDEK